MKSIWHSSSKEKTVNFEAYVKRIKEAIEALISDKTVPAEEVINGLEEVIEEL